MDPDHLLKVGSTQGIDSYWLSCTTPRNRLHVLIVHDAVIWTDTDINKGRLVAFTTNLLIHQAVFYFLEGL